VSAAGEASGGVGFVTGRLPPAAEVVDRALWASTQNGAVAIVTDGTEAEIRFANNMTTTNGVRHDRTVVVASFLDKGDGTAVGVASASGSVDVTELVRRAERAAASADPADDASPLLDGGADPRFAEVTAADDLPRLRPVVEGMGDAFARAKAEGRVLAGFVEHRTDTVCLGTSTGIRRRHVQPVGRVQLLARSADGSRAAWVGVGPGDFDAARIPVLEERVATRLSWADRQIDRPAGRYDVILPPDAVSDLMALAGDALSRRDAEDGRSVFAATGGGTRLGEVLSPLAFNLHSDPAQPGIECVPFLASGMSGTDVSVFDNGLPLEHTDWIAEGRLANLRSHRAGARKWETAPVPPVDNMILELPGSTDTVEDLVARVDSGLLVTCLWYIREVDPATLLLTGLTRDGVYVIDKGEIVGATTNFRFNESPIHLLGRVTEAGRCERALSREFNEYMPRSAMASLRIPDFNMSTVSAAN
jgi:predicted Zn-dependent protease